MSAQSHKSQRKTYSMPLLRCYGSVVTMTQGASGPKADGGGVQAKA